MRDLDHPIVRAGGERILGVLLIGALLALGVGALFVFRAIAAAAFEWFSSQTAAFQ